MIGLAFALMVQAGLSRALQLQGYEQTLAHDLAYLAVPPILLVMLAPVLFRHRGFLMRLFRPSGLSVRLALAAVALGLAARIAWWSQLIARISLGITVNDDPQAMTGPYFAWTCPPLPSLTLGFLVMAALIPLMEETVDRGLLQSAFVHRGPVPAVLISAAVFTVFHPPSSYAFVFLMGIILGIQFWVTGSIWTTIITHATYNGLIQFDWRCLQGYWNPSPERLPQLLPGIVSLTVFMAAAVLIVVLLRCQWAGAQVAPAPVVSPARSRHAR